VVYRMRFFISMSFFLALVRDKTRGGMIVRFNGRTRVRVILACRHPKASALGYLKAELGLEVVA
jgi:hypothetical protein